MSISTQLSARRLSLRGAVQGFGFRPAVARLADAIGVFGHVKNSPAGLEIHIEGPEYLLAKFEAELNDHTPPAALVVTVIAETVAPQRQSSFSIKESERTAGTQSVMLPRDLTMCEACASELRNPRDRRFRHPMNSCTHCGPRYTIISNLPYDRSATSMGGYAMCPTCRIEFEDRFDRRYHAQTIACPDCGPKVWFVNKGDSKTTGYAAIAAAAASIRQDQIVALRGIGGYQLLANAASSAAITRLRVRKRRPSKPLAVMVGSLAAAEEVATLSPDESRALTDERGPIVLVPARSDSRICDVVHPGQNTLGVMLPTTPVHAMLMDLVDCPVVCTSGNIHGEPLAFEAEDAARAFESIADATLEHDRRIVRPIDDSVVRVMANNKAVVRNARGFSPTPLPLTSALPIVAVGGHQKVAIAIASEAQALLGPHIGDMDTLAGRERLVNHIDDLTRMCGVERFQVACDLHPEYFTTAWAEQHPIVCRVQHHHAHVVSGMLEHGWLDRKVLGIALDGTGFGTDGTIWGGEILICTATESQRIGRLRIFPLPGGEQAVREPWRVAVALLHQSLGQNEFDQYIRRQPRWSSILPVLSNAKFSPWTSSAGRLFDGVSALTLGLESAEFEGQGPMQLEALCDKSESGHYSLKCVGGGDQFELDWRPAIRQLVADQAQGVSAAAMAMKFHRGLAFAIRDICQSIPELPIVFSGGVFQNAILVNLLHELMSEWEREIGMPGWIPTNDGGLAAGQLAVAVKTLESQQEGSPSCA